MKRVGLIFRAVTMVAIVAALAWYVLCGCTFEGHLHTYEPHKHSHGTATTDGDEPDLADEIRRAIERASDVESDLEN